MHRQIPLILFILAICTIVAGWIIRIIDKDHWPFEKLTSRELFDFGIFLMSISAWMLVWYKL